MCLVQTVCYHVRSLWKRSVRSVKFDPAGLGMPGPPRVGNDVRSREQGNSKERRELWTDADICCGIPEFRLRSVFGTQLSGIWTNPPQPPPQFHCIFLCPFLLFLPSRPQCSHLYSENHLSQLPSVCFVPFRHSSDSNFLSSAATCEHTLFPFRPIASDLPSYFSQALPT